MFSTSCERSESFCLVTLVTELIHNVALIFGDELVVHLGSYLGMSMPHLRLAVLEIGAGHAEPVVVRAPHHQPVHPGHLEFAASQAGMIKKNATP